MSLTHAHPRARRTVVGALTAVLTLSAAGCGTTSGGDRHEQAVAKAVSSVGARANSLGRPTAPYTLTFYVAPTSATLSDVVLPQLPGVVDRYVRGGQVRVDVRTLGGSPFANSDDALQASRLVQAAGLQGRFWPALLQLADHYNGALAQVDQSGLLRGAGVGNVQAALKARSDPRITGAIRRANALAMTQGSRHYDDAYVVSNPRGVRVDVTSDAVHGRLASGMADAMKVISG